MAKFWLRPIVLANSTGFAAHELRQLKHLVEEHQHKFVEARDEFFSN